MTATLLVVVKLKLTGYDSRGTNKKQHYRNTNNKISIILGISVDLCQDVVSIIISAIIKDENKNLNLITLHLKNLNN